MTLLDAIYALFFFVAILGVSGALVMAFAWAIIKFWIPLVDKWLTESGQ